MGSLVDADTSKAGVSDSSAEFADVDKEPSASRARRKRMSTASTVDWLHLHSAEI